MHLPLATNVIQFLFIGTSSHLFLLEWKKKIVLIFIKTLLTTCVSCKMLLVFLYYF